jgi:DNA-binding transcriptional LysR family regulator
MRTTPQGDHILRRASDIVDAVERLQEFCLSVASGRGGIVSVACYPVHLERFLAAALGELRRLAPGVQLDLTRVRDDRRRQLGRSLFDELRNHEVQLAMGPPQPGHDLDGIHAYDARLVMMLPDSDPQRHAATVPVTALRDRPILAAPAGFFSHETVASACREEGFELLVEIESASPSALIALGRHGVGVPVLPDDYSAVRDERFPYPVLTHNDRELLTPVGLQWVRARPLEPAASSLVAVARRFAQADGLGLDLYAPQLD